MGALHEGHLSLVRAARVACGSVAATIFLNPTQFAPAEDLAHYPRTFQADCTLLEREGVDLLFAPSAQEMYPAGPGAPATFVEVPELSDRLDGRSREHHFRGVATVVTKLFHIVNPSHAFFGQKDAAQVVVLRAMVRDLNFDIELVVCPTVREPDGLAMSSRNRYLTAEQRTRATVLSQALRQAENAVHDGETDPAKLRASLADAVLSTPSVRLDYAELSDPETLLPVDDLRGGALVAVAVWIENADPGTPPTRLIDNILLAPMPRPSENGATASGRDLNVNMHRDVPQTTDLEHAR
jgi:pantoate--beta-alanine ligase